MVVTLAFNLWFVTFCLLVGCVGFADWVLCVWVVKWVFVGWFMLVVVGVR